jgi:hypothetical protein
VFYLFRLTFVNNIQWFGFLIFHLASDSRLCFFQGKIKERHRSSTENIKASKTDSISLYGNVGLIVLLPLIWLLAVSFLPISTYATTNDNNTGDFVVSNTTILSPQNNDKAITTQTILGILKNPSNKSIDNVDVFIQAFDSNNGLIGFNNSTLSSIIDSLGVREELLRTLQSPFQISVDTSIDDIFDHYKLMID